MSLESTPAAGAAAAAAAAVQPTLRVEVRYFASIREALGHGSETMQTQAATLGALRAELIARGEPWATALGHGRAVRMALDQTLSGEDAALRTGAEVAFFPPVTGG